MSTPTLKSKEMVIYISDRDAKTAQNMPEIAFIIVTSFIEVLLNKVDIVHRINITLVLITVIGRGVKMDTMGA